MADLTPRMSAQEFLRLQHGKVPAAAPKRHKYGAQRTELDGQVFDSRKEARYWQSLQLARLAENPAQRVVAVERSRRFELIPKQDGERATTYVCDFYVTYGDGHVEVVDTKSVVTRRLPAYVIKRKLMLERHGIRVIEI